MGRRQKYGPRRERTPPQSVEEVAARIDQLLDGDWRHRYVAARHLDALAMTARMDRNSPERELINRALEAASQSRGGIAETALGIATIITAAQDYRMREFGKETDRDDRVLDRLEARIERATTPEDAKLAKERMARVLAVTIGRECVSESVQSRMLTIQMTSGQILSSCPELLLTCPEALAAMMNQRETQNTAAGILQELGPRAAAVAPILIRQIDTLTEYFDHNAVDAVAAVIRDDTELIRSIIGRLESPRPETSNVARRIVSKLGPLAAAADPGLIDRQWDRARSILSTTPDPWEDCAIFEPISMLSSIAERRDDVALWVLRLTQDAPNDALGCLIDALGCLRAAPDAVIPWLVSALDRFEEYDYDMMYGGEHARIFEALSRFGPAAAPALDATVSRIWCTAEGDEGVRNQAALRLIAEIGPAASGALPLLERIAAEDDDFDIDDEFDTLAEAIRSVRGQPKGTSDD